VPRLLTLVCGLGCLAACQPGNVPLTTQHNDVGRTGANLTEGVLTPSAVNGKGSTRLRLRTWRPLDGDVDVQALYVPYVTTTAGVRNVIYVETTNNWVDAYDAVDTSSPGTTAGRLWHVHLPVTPDSHLSNPLQGGDAPMGTPVIDQATNTMYVVYGIDNGAFPVDGQGDSGYSVAFHIAALDIGSGAVLRDSVIHAQVPSTVAPGHADFAPQRQIQRAGLLLSPDLGSRGPKSVYVAFASRWREETTNWHGWVMRYDAATLKLLGAFCSTPDQRSLSDGGGIWEGGGGLVSDDSGNVYFNTGNGPSGANAYGNSIVRLAPTASTTPGLYPFTVSSFSAAADDPVHASEWANNDIDLGAGGLTLVPGTRSLIGGGKTGVYYLMNTNGGLAKVEEFVAFTNWYDPLGRYAGWNTGPHLHGAPTYWPFSPDSGFVYAWGEKDSLRRYTYHTATGLLDSTHGAAAPILADNNVMPGGNITLSANASTNGILWVTHPLTVHGELLAFDALSLQQLWSDSLPDPANFIPPTVTNGMVIVPTGNGSLLIYDLESSQIVLRPRPEPFPPYRIPLGDPAPRVAAAQLEAPPGAMLMFTAAAVGDVLIDDMGLRPSMGYRGRGDTLATLKSTAKGLTIRARDSSRVSLRRLDSTLFRVDTRQGSGLLDHVEYVQRKGNLVVFWRR
jgi:hypothetical protein